MVHRNTIFVFINVHLRVNDHNFEHLDNLKFLGIVINHTLMWHVI